MRWIIGLLLAAGCSEYEVNGEPPGLEGGDQDLQPTPGDGSGTAGNGGSTRPGDNNDGGFDDGGGLGTDDFPEEFIPGDDCADGVLATWLSGEIFVLASSGGPAIGEIDVPQAGVYDLYDIALAESGDSQRNESAYLRVPNQSNAEGKPLITNCGPEYVVPDSDNISPPAPGTTQYMGTFWFEQGVNTVEMHHYCWLVEAGGCTTFHDPDPASACGSGNANSVHMTGQAICLRPVN